MCQIDRFRIRIGLHLKVRGQDGASVRLGKSRQRVSQRLRRLLHGVQGIDVSGGMPVRQELEGLDKRIFAL